MVQPTQDRPTAEGRFERNPFAHALLFALDRGLSGEMRIGRSREALDLAPEARFLISRGMVVAGHFQGAWPARLGDAVVAACCRGEGHYSFHEREAEPAPPAGWLSGREDPRTVLAVALRTGKYPQRVIDATVGASLKVTLERSDEVLLDAYGLTDAERGWVEAIEGPVTGESLLSRDGLPEPAAAGLLYLLRITRALRNVTPFRRRATTVALPAQNPVESGVVERGANAGGPGGAAQRALLLDMYRRLPSTDHFGFLGLSRSASSAEARRAHDALAARFDPEKLPDDMLDLLPKAEAVRGRLEQAIACLGTPMARLRYLGDLDAGGGRPDDPHGLGRVCSATVHLERAQRLIQSGVYGEASWHARRALVADRHDPVARGTVAYLSFAGSKRAPQDVNNTIAALERALRKRPGHPALHGYMAAVLRHAGEEERARAHVARARRAS